MKKYSVLCLILACSMLTVPASAEQADYCFREADFEEELTGICLQKIPQEGVLMLGDRVLRPGDVLTAGQAEKMTYHSVSGRGGEICYLPVLREGVQETALFRIPGKKNEAPVAEDSALETYKNLPNMGTLRVYDPEQKELTITVVQQPRRGTVTLGEKGTFTYTPKKNKVGEDSFTYTAADPEGNVSREAAVSITILKPTEAAMYQDTMGLSCSYAAEWMKNTGIFAAEAVGETCCFQPEKPVTRGEFLTMLLKTLDIPGEEKLTAGMDQIPGWLRPYAAAALRSGITAGLPAWDNFSKNITQAETAVLTENALDLPAGTISEKEDLEPAWAVGPLTALEKQEIQLTGEEILTRGKAAELLYSISLVRGTR